MPHDTPTLEQINTMGLEDLQQLQGDRAREKRLEETRRLEQEAEAIDIPSGLGGFLREGLFKTARSFTPFTSAPSPAEAAPASSVGPLLTVGPALVRGISSRILGGITGSLGGPGGVAAGVAAAGAANEAQEIARERRIQADREGRDLSAFGALQEVATDPLALARIGVVSGVDFLTAGIGGQTAVAARAALANAAVQSGKVPLREALKVGFKELGINVGADAVGGLAAATAMLIEQGLTPGSPEFLDALKTQGAFQTVISLASGATGAGLNVRGAARQARAETAFTGVQQVRPGSALKPAQLFTDVETGSTFTVGEGERLVTKLALLRAASEGTPLTGVIKPETNQNAPKAPIREALGRGLAKVMPKAKPKLKPGREAELDVSEVDPNQPVLVRRTSKDAEGKITTELVPVPFSKIGGPNRKAVTARAEALQEKLRTESGRDHASFTDKGGRRSMNMAEFDANAAGIAKDAYDPQQNLPDQPLTIGQRAAQGDEDSLETLRLIGEQPAPTPEGPFAKAFDFLDGVATTVFGSTGRAVSRLGPGPARMVRMMQDSLVGMRGDTAVSSVRLEGAFKGMTRAERKQVKDINFVGLVRKRAEPFENPRLENFYQVWLQEQTRVARAMNEVTGGQAIKDGVTGPRPVNEGDPRFFPQQLKKDVLDDLMSGRESRFREVADELTANGSFDTAEEALLFLRESFDSKHNGFFGPLERPRQVIFPDRMLEPDPVKVMNTYLHASWRRIHEIKQFGQDSEGAVRSLLLSGQPGGSRGRAQANDLYDRFFGIKKDGTRINSMASNYIALTKVGNLLNGIFLQTSQFGNTVTTAGGRNMIRAFRDVMGKPEARRFLHLSGVVERDYLRNIADLGERFIDAPLGKAANAVLTAQGTVHVDMATRMVNARATAYWAHDAAQYFRENVDVASRGVRRKKGELTRMAKRLGFEEGTLDDWAANGIAPEDVRKVMFESNRFSQFENDPLTRVTWGHNSVGRMATTLKTFSIQQGRFIGRQVIGEAAQGNFKPMMAMMATWGLQGELYTFVKNKLFGMERAEGPDNIFLATLHRLAVNISAVGTLGIISDSVRTDPSGREVIGPRNIATPVILESVGNVFSALREIVISTADERDFFDTAAFEFIRLIDQESVAFSRVRRFLETQGALDPNSLSRRSAKSKSVYDSSKRGRRPSRPTR